MIGLDALDLVEGDVEERRILLAHVAQVGIGTSRDEYAPFTEAIGIVKVECSLHWLHHWIGHRCLL